MNPRNLPPSTLKVQLLTPNFVRANNVVLKIKIYKNKKSNNNINKNKNKIKIKIKIKNK